MMNEKALSALRQYAEVGVHSSMEAASPHRVIQLLMDGVLTRLASASGCMQRGETAQKGQQISAAISIIDGLRASLDMRVPGGIGQNLDQLYDYMEQRLFEANLNNDQGIIGEVSVLMGSIKSGWDAIADDASAMALAAQPETERPLQGVLER